MSSTLPRRAAARALLTLVLACAPPVLACEGTPSGVKLTVIVDGVRTQTGLLTATVYGPDRARFLKAAGSLLSARTPPQPPVTQLCLWLPHPGAYEVGVFQDLNMNQRFDHSGLKLEPYGFSNNPHLFMAPPTLEAARFDAPAGETTIHVHLHHSVGS